MRRHDEYTFSIDDVELFLVDDKDDEPFDAKESPERAAEVFGIKTAGINELLAYLDEIKNAFKRDLISLYEERVS